MANHKTRPRKPVEYQWRPTPIGPRFQWLDRTHIRVRERELAGQEFELATEVDDTTANAYLAQHGKRIGQTCIERDPPGKGVILWDIAVKEDYRRKSLASIMTYCIFRELLLLQDISTFRIRMMRLIKPADKELELQNIGIGVIGNRLGFTPELDIERLLSPDNVTGVELIPARHGFAPGLKISITTYPLVLIAFILDRDTMKPVHDPDTYLRLLPQQKAVHEWVESGLIVIGNGDYWLRPAGIDRFLDCIAIDAAEADRFRKRIQGL